MIIKVFDGYNSKYKGTEVDEAVGKAIDAASKEGNNVFTGSNEFQGIVNLGSLATVDTVDPTDDSEKVANTAFVKAQGYITGITSEDVVEALGYTPYDGTTNPAGFITGISSEDVVEALGYTPEDVANKVTSLNGNNTDTQYPSAKAVYSVTSAYGSAIASNTSAIQTNTSNIAINASAIATNTASIGSINDKIPSAASSENQLADKNFVNSSIATSTATFRGTFNSVAELEAYTGPKDDNDYAFVVSTDSAGNTLYNRYKYTGTEWLFEYSLNNSSFTSVQWSAINSGATTTNIGQIAVNTSAIASNTSAIATNTTNIGINTSVIEVHTSAIADLATSKQDTIADLETIRAGATAGATALQPNDNITELNNNAGYISGITSIMIVDALTYTPYDGTTNPEGFISGIDFLDVVDALGYTPYDNSNPSGFISSISSSDVTTALGYTPYDSTNPSGYISSASVSTLTDVTLSSVANGQALLYNSTSGKWENKNIVTSISWGGITGTLADQTDLQNALNEKTTMAAVEAKGYITGIDSSMINTALGYTPYDGTTNPNGYIIGISSADVVSALGYTPYDSANPNGYISNVSSGMVTTALGYTPYDASNPAGYINSSAIADMQTTTNLVTTISSVSTDSTYPSAKCVYDAIQAGGGSSSLSGLSDVEITSVAQGETLTYDSILGKWKNTLSTATIAWGGITGTLADQTDLRNALEEKTTKFYATNPALTSTDGICTWSITNTVGSKRVQVSVYDVSTNKEVMVDVTPTDSTISIEFVSDSDISANSYEAVVVG